MLAVALHLDFAEHDDVVIALNVFKGARKLLGRVHGIALEPVAIGVDHPLGSVDDAFPAGIIAGPGDEGANRLHGFFPRGALHGVEGPVAARSIHGVLSVRYWA